VKRDVVGFSIENDRRPLISKIGTINHAEATPFNVVEDIHLFAIEAHTSQYCTQSIFPSSAFAISKPVLVLPLGFIQESVDHT
jgi:hypothetical protein